MVILCELLCHRLGTDVNYENSSDIKFVVHKFQIFTAIPVDPLKEPCVRHQWAVDYNHGLGHRLPRTVIIVKTVGLITVKN